jgi:hypothetical protein
VLANYYLNRLPEDGICYWDLIFTSGAEERDSSAAAIAACGLLELATALPLLDPLRADYQGLRCARCQELSEHYLSDGDVPGGGLLLHAVYHKPQRMGIDESCIWGDYFYLESLVRLSRSWQSYW